MDYVQHPPYNVKLELSEGCNLYCPFCGLQGIREKGKPNYKFLTVELAEKVGKLVAEACATYNWNPRFEMAMHGEPTMNPKRAEIVAALRNFLPKTHLMMTSNGGGLLSGDTTKNIQELMDAGLNVLALDDYKYVDIVAKIKKAWPMMRIYPEDPTANPYTRRKASEHEVIVMPDISDTDKGVHSHISNHCGAAFPENDDMDGKRCARPFRELAITWDGTVVLCCNDWRREFPLKNLKDVTDIHNEVWLHPAMTAIRKYLYHGRREPGPCKGCDSKSFRVGLLPDPQGLEYLDRPKDADVEEINKILAKGPATKPVLRPWERKDAEGKVETWKGYKDADIHPNKRQN